ncbi:MAG: thioredoxin fold domain-containing protein [Rhodothermales bacterium]|nr:thioredoxin fold domain-containing protein [Rhodothermales bacterium]
MNRFVLVALLILLVARSSDAWAQPSWARLDEASRAAAGATMPVLVYVHAPGCGPCLKMEREVFPHVAPLLDRFARARLDLDDSESRLVIDDVALSPAEWAHRLGANATPTFIFLEPGGGVITRTSGYTDTRGFALLLAYVATGAYRHARFEAYVEQAGGRP